jgi:anti-sigma regulatory factor (Ser/Thr protein kinase)
VADLELVVAELVTNAVEHGTGSGVVVELDIDPSVVTVSVTSGGGADLGGPSDWVMPPVGSTSGRGLALVRALVDDVEWSMTDGRTTVRVVRRYGVD